jgi:hypothetical protein
VGNDDAGEGERPTFLDYAAQLPPGHAPVLLSRLLRDYREELITRCAACRKSIHRISRADSP